jgi:type II secretion system (T2SS) protein K
MRKPSPSCKRDSGAALLLALWALFLLAGVVFAWALNINSRLTVSATANRVLSAEAMASSGAEVALNPTIKPASANLHRKMGNESYDVEMSGECGRFNLNLLAPGGAENPAFVGVLKRYLTLKGVELTDLDVMMDSLLDWISPTKGLHRLNAPEETDDYRPSHAPLTSVDELKKIFGWAEYTSHPGWDEDFTVITNGCQKIDIAWAARDVLRALGIGDDQVDAFLQLRRGPDGIDGTPDDLFSAGAAGSPASVNGGQGVPPAVVAALGLNPQQMAQLVNLVGFNLPIWRIVSVGRSSDVTRSVQMVVQKQVMSAGIAAGVGAAISVNQPQVFSWKEL